MHVPLVRRNGPDGHGDSDDGEARESEAVTEPTDRNPDPTLSAGNNDSQHVAYTSSISDASRPSPDEGGEGSRNIEGPGLRRVHQFMLKIKPKDADGPSGPSWQELQLEPTPTLLPDLRYVCRRWGLERDSFMVWCMKCCANLRRPCGFMEHIRSNSAALTAGWFFDSGSTSSDLTARIVKSSSRTLSTNYI